MTSSEVEKGRAVEYVKLGPSGLYVSKLVLGTLDFGTNVSEEESFRIMDKALELGINFWDTSNSYGVTDGRESRFGRAETVIGRYFATHAGARQRVVLNTKCFMRLGDSSYGPNDVEGISAYKMQRQLDDSLERLQTDHVELLTIHQYQEGMNWAEVWDAYERLFASGKACYAGASNFTAYALARCQEEARCRHLLGLVSEQNRYNLACRQIEPEVVPALRGEHISLLAWSPLFGGRLTNKVFNPPKTGRRIRRAPSGELARKLHAYADVCHEYGLAEQDVALSWVIHNPNVGCVLTGGNSVAELEDCARCMDLELPESCQRDVEKIFPGYRTSAELMYMFG